MSEITARLKSVHLDNERTIWIQRPRQSKTARGLVVFLDGEFYHQKTKVDAPAIVAGLEGRMADAWCVYVSMHSMEARARECPCYPPFATFIVDELLPWLAKKHPEIASVERRVLAGLSYTGLAAPFVAMQYPGAFQAVIAQSGSFWWDDCHLIKEFDRLSSPLPTAFYLDVGKKETDIDNDEKEPDPKLIQKISQVESARRLRDTLLAHGHDVKYVEFDGGHDFKGWKRTLPGALEWALPPGAK
ncbi:MAG: alpha/beta hydrolase-fold protein [Verrucomicrobiota bacterium]